MRAIDIARIPGDPEAMRATAKTIKSLARDFARAASDVKRATGDMQYAGPFGQRFKGDVLAMMRDCASEAKRLTELASEIEVAARDLERRQEERQRLIDQLRREEMERMRRAGGN